MLQSTPTEESIENASAHTLADKYHLVNNNKRDRVWSTKEQTRHDQVNTGCLNDLSLHTHAVTCIFCKYPIVITQKLIHTGQWKYHFHKACPSHLFPSFLDSAHFTGHFKACAGHIINVPKKSCVGHGIVHINSCMW